MLSIQRSGSEWAPGLSPPLVFIVPVRRFQNLREGGGGHGNHIDWY